MARRFDRILSSIPTALALVFVGLCFSAFTLFNNPTTQRPLHLTLLVILGLFISLIFLINQTYLEYKRRIYDPTLALKFQDAWESREDARKAACQIIQLHKEKLAKIDEYESILCPIDDPLDILEDIGFYVQGDQISPEVAHHHFYHWIRGYWCAAQQYIQAWQTKETARWQHLASLYDETSEVELSLQGGNKGQLWRTDEQITEFLRQEISE